MFLQIMLLARYTNIYKHGVVYKHGVINKHAWTTELLSLQTNF